MDWSKFTEHIAKQTAELAATLKGIDTIGGILKKKDKSGDKEEHPDKEADEKTPWEWALPLTPKFKGALVKTFPVFAQAVVNQQKELQSVVRHFVFQFDAVEEELKNMANANKKLDARIIELEKQLAETPVKMKRKTKTRSK